MSTAAAQLKLLKELTQEVRELDVGWSVDQVEIQDLPVARFIHEYVSSNKPCLIKGAISHWPALRKWNIDYLSSVTDTPVTVDLTPNGFGDAVTALGSTSQDGGAAFCFATPHECRMPLAGFFALMAETRSKDTPLVPYLQHQNSNLTEELRVLVDDVDEALPWANEAFGAPPDAVNLWIGDDRSTTSFHKDHYENLYAVVNGTKIFTLLPPSDIYRMYLARYPAATFTPRTTSSCFPDSSSTPTRPCPSSPDSPTSQPASSNSSCSKPGGNCRQSTSVSFPDSFVLSSGATNTLAPVLKDPPLDVIWCPINPYPEGEGQAAAACDRYPLFFDPELPPPLRVEVGPGDLLYLPSMWYHYVQQKGDTSGLVTAVNYWYDMKFDVKYSYFNLVRSLAVNLGLTPRPDTIADAAATGEEEESC